MQAFDRKGFLERWIYGKCHFDKKRFRSGRLITKSVHSWVGE